MVVSRNSIVWKHVSIVKEPEKAGNQPIVECCYCLHRFHGGATRIRCHLLGTMRLMGVICCPSVTAEVRAQLQAEYDRVQATVERKRKLEVLDKRTASGSGGGTQLEIGGMFNKVDKNAVDSAWAKAFFANGLPFNLLNNSHFKQAVHQTAMFGNTYKMPSTNRMRGTLLDDCKADIDAECQELRNSWAATGVTITVDGCSDANNRPLLNIIAVSTKGALFLRAVDTSGEYKTGSYIAEQIGLAIEEIGPEKVVQVVTDSASNCKAAGDIICQRFPHIVWTPCSTHCMDLLLEDIGRLPWVAEVITDGANAMDGESHEGNESYASYEEPLSHFQFGHVDKVPDSVCYNEDDNDIYLYTLLARLFPICKCQCGLHFMICPRSGECTR